jgi:Flp pilus assembly protein TadG
MRHIEQISRNTRSKRKMRGVAVIEFAIVLPLLVLIVTGLIEYGRLMWNYNALAKASRDAARYLSTVDANDLANEASQNNSTANKMVRDAALSAGLDITGLSIAISCDDIPNCSTASGTNKPDRVEVAIGYPFTIGGWVPVFGTDIRLVTLSPHTTMPYMRQ